MKSTRIPNWKSYCRLYESKRTESEALRILSIRGMESQILQELKQLDTSQDQKNLELMSVFIEDRSDRGFFKTTFKTYTDLVKTGIIKPVTISTKENEVRYPDGSFIWGNTGFLKFSAWVDGKRPIKKTKRETIKKNPSDSPIISKNGIEVYLADTKEKAQRWSNGALTGKSYTFCIGNLDPARNAYYAYRNEDNTIYFIIDKNRELEDPLHIVVWMTDEEFGLTDANNETGSIAEFGDGKESYEGYAEYLESKGISISTFKNVPLSDKEKRIIEIRKMKDLSLVEFQSLEPEDRLYYLDTHEITDELWPYIKGNSTLLDRVFNLGKSIREDQFQELTPKQKKGYTNSVVKRIENRDPDLSPEFVPWELNVLSEDPKFLQRVKKSDFYRAILEKDKYPIREEYRDKFQNMFGYDWINTTEDKIPHERREEAKKILEEGKTRSMGVLKQFIQKYPKAFSLEEVKREEDSIESFWVLMHPDHSKHQEEFQNILRKYNNPRISKKLEEYQNALEEIGKREKVAKGEEKNELIKSAKSANAKYHMFLIKRGSLEILDMEELSRKYGEDPEKQLSITLRKKALEHYRSVLKKILADLEKLGGTLDLEDPEFTEVLN